jgi:hypothetical protein
MLKKLITLSIISIFCSQLPAQNFKTSAQNNNFTASENSIIYALPRTYLKISVEVTKTTTIKGPYAEYAQKYLGIFDVPLENSTSYKISSIDLQPVNEPDPNCYYAITFKNFPENLRTLLTNNCGLILYQQPVENKSDIYNEKEFYIFDSRYIDETLKEKTDTLYKTIIKDSSIIKIPVFKKQIQAKSDEDLIKETAHELIKIRKRRLKLARGEYEFHPDGETLKVMFAELQKQEDEYLTLFQGIKHVEKQIYNFLILPDQNLSETKVASFDNIKGINNAEVENFITLKFNPETDIKTNTSNTGKQDFSNTIFYRTPVFFKIDILYNNEIVTKFRVPLYQFGLTHNCLIK